MADISMCEGTGCPKKQKCWRFKAPVNKYKQAYIVGIPYNKKTKKCDMFWEFKSIEKKVSLRELSKAWKELYGENFRTEYPGVFKHLKKLIK